MPTLTKETALFKPNQISNDITTAGQKADHYIKAVVNDTGLMVADMRNGTATPETETGRNVLIDSDSVNIRDGQDVLASFGEEVVIGKSDESNLLITAGNEQTDTEAGMYIIDENGDAAAKFSGNIVQIGKSDGANVLITPSAISGSSEAGKVFAFNFSDSVLHLKTITNSATKKPPGDIVVTLKNAIMDTTMNLKLRVTGWGSTSTTAINTVGETITFTLTPTCTLSATVMEKIYDKQKIVFEWSGDTSGMSAAMITTEYIADAGLAPSFAFGLMPNDEDPASGAFSFSAGLDTVSEGLCSHAQNRGTIASSENQTAMGAFNVKDTSDEYALIIGNGTSDSFMGRSNAFAVGWDGNLYLGFKISTSTVDRDLYTTITTLGWESDVIE